MLLAFYMCPDGIQIANKILEYESKPMIFSDFLNVSADLKGPKVKYNLNYGLCRGLLFRADTRHKRQLQ